ncbi:PIN domain nuclease [Kitasatospora sp. CM 4170]|uniref:Ribonuclease VapC n=1 Tax=Kitasatospora aburaviensis TaxID=67265 RepID=A0ABW1ENQ6_9ACTN|nr:PIN domain nuclease [Kitasatospora sp. CM 4170]WNM48652.1 PIN domain nuclease [Kitasatospora sp. CM 4170]
MSERFLIDKSAFARYAKPAVRAVIDQMFNEGLLALCGAVELEIMHSARSKTDADRIREGLRGFDWLSTPDEVWDRAVEVQALLTSAGNWRALSVADLVIAAVAERHGCTVLHYDGDYDMIAAVTGQSTRWVVPPGTAD